MRCHIKICGLSTIATLHAAIDAGADLVGFVHFSKSPRYVSLARAAELQALLPDNIESVLVVVDPDDALLSDITKKLRPGFIQLHGNETPERVREISMRYPKQKLIKALPIASKEDLADAKLYESHVNMLMFDAKPPEGALLPGGNGIAFDWTILKGFKSSVPWILSGGLTPENVREAIRQSGTKMVDVSSGVESAPGIKDSAKIKAFISAALS